MSQSTSEFLEAANHIGARLCRDAIFAGDRCNWIGASLEWIGGEWSAVERALGPDLYAGTSGIALFLARLCEYTGDRIQRLTARSALRQACSSLRSGIVTSDMGLYSGATGIAYVLVEAEKVFPDEGLATLAVDTVRCLPFTMKRSIDIDLISGGAGAIMALLALAKRTSEACFLESAARLGDGLIERARRRDGALSWRTGDFPAFDDLAGLSHGAAGVALALIELWSTTEEARFRQAAEAGFAYEKGLFNPQRGNWPDLRINPETPSATAATPTFMTAWCHGAPGIGLSRLRAFELTNDEWFRHEAEVAIRTTMSDLLNTSSSGFSLCHGTFGNSEVLLAASEVLKDRECRNLIETVALKAALDHQHDEHWSCGIPGGGETPNLMLGLAGIGYHFLRLYDNRSNPSVLCIS